uniref:Aminotran_1_2 domain-containing protein n=1 Tax=Rhabditophanes sp. KR3021 TaxID=114890 RepID=A0AC35TKD0_9BILA
MHIERKFDMSLLYNSYKRAPETIRRFLTTSSPNMTSRKPSVKYVDTKESIWVEFTQLAAANKQCVNIGQGFPDFESPKFVADFLKNIADHNERPDYMQYTRSFGDPRLVSSLARLYQHTLGVDVSPNDDVLVTTGAYMALYYTFTAWLNPGDEVLVLEPAYDCYLPQINAAGAKAVPVCLEFDPTSNTSAGFKLDIKMMESKINDKTKMIVNNNPNNPTGKLFTRKELEDIAGLAKKYDLIVVSDEVYSHHIMPGNKMIPFASLPGMYDRTITIGSAGKLFSITGWKIGFAIGPNQLMKPLRQIHQNCSFNTATPLQVAVGQGIDREMDLIEKNNIKDSYLYTTLPETLAKDRDLMAAMFTKAGMKPIIPEAGYFMLADVTNVKGDYKNKKYGTTDPLDFNFCRWLIKEKNLAVIPPSAFYSEEFKAKNSNMIRACFFKKETTLAAAEKILLNL